MDFWTSSVFLQMLPAPQLGWILSFFGGVVSAILPTLWLMAFKVPSKSDFNQMSTMVDSIDRRLARVEGHLGINLDAN